MHAAKGLEFPVVFVPGMEESIFPHSRALYDQSEMEEERRLCYVAMTRAKEELYLISASTRILYGNLQANPPSRFLAEIEEKNQLEKTTENSFFSAAKNNYDEPRYELDLQEGDSVRHQLFGESTIVEKNNNEVAVYFKNKGVKRLNTSFAPLEKIE